MKDNARPGPAPNIYERTLSLPVPMSDSKMLLKLLILHLQSDAPSAPVLKIIFGGGGGAAAGFSRRAIFSHFSRSGKIGIDHCAPGEISRRCEPRFSRVAGYASAGGLSHAPVCPQPGFGGRSPSGSPPAWELKARRLQKQARIREEDLQNCVSGFPAGAARKGRNSPRLPRLGWIFRAFAAGSWRLPALAWFGRLVGVKTPGRAMSGILRFN